MYSKARVWSGHEHSWPHTKKKMNKCIMLQFSYISRYENFLWNYKKKIRYLNSVCGAICYFVCTSVKINK